MTDMNDTLSSIRQQRTLRTRKRYARSKLDRYKAELLSLKQAGASYTEMQFWLQQQRTSVAISTIARWFDKQSGH